MKKIDESKRKKIIGLLPVLAVFMAILLSAVFLIFVQGKDEGTVSTKAFESDWQETTRKTYVDTCIPAAKQNGQLNDLEATDYCQCTLDELEMAYKEAEFAKAERQIQDNPNQVPSKIQAAINKCGAKINR